MPALAAENRVERGSRRRQFSAGQRSQDHRVVALFEHRLLGNLPIGRVAQSLHQLVVLGFGLVLLLLQTMQDDIRIGDALEP
jgi:hypothetical protein